MCKAYHILVGLLVTHGSWVLQALPGQVDNTKCVAIDSPNGIAIDDPHNVKAGTNTCHRTTSITKPSERVTYGIANGV